MDDHDIHNTPENYKIYEESVKNGIGYCIESRSAEGIPEGFCARCKVFCTWRLFMLHRHRTFSRSEYSWNGRSHWNSSRICKISGNTCRERNRFNSNSTCKVHAFQIVRKLVCILVSHKMSDEDVKAYISMTKMALQSISPTAPDGTFSIWRTNACIVDLNNHQNSS